MRHISGGHEFIQGIMYDPLVLQAIITGFEFENICGKLKNCTALIKILDTMLQTNTYRLHIHCPP